MRRAILILAVTGFAAWSLPVQAQEKTLRFAYPGDLIAMDPHTANETFTTAALHHIYEGLSVYDRELKIVPGLATTSGDYGDLSNKPSLGTAAAKNVGTAAGNVPELDGSGKLDTAVLPAVAITDTFVINSQAAMLALTAEKGDVAIRTDLNKSFILQTNSPTTLADWKELLTPTDAVLSVAGLTGTISASALKTALAIAQADVSGLTTASSPQFAGLNIGHASDTTVSRLSAGDVAVEGNRIFRAGGTDVPVADGGTGASDASGARTNLGIGSMATRAVTISTSDPSGGTDGDVWLKYTP